MIKYIIPFFYTFYSRVKNNGKRIAYFFTFIIPVLIYGLIVSYDSEKNMIITIIAIVVGLIGTMSIYEIGYIRNDVFTIKKEKNPTLRLSENDLIYVENNITIILIIKYLFSILSVIIISFLEFKYTNFFIGLILIEIVYFIHNKVRGKLSIFSFFVLSTLRYVTPLLVINTNIYVIILVFIFSISIPRTIEKASDFKFNIKFLQFVLNSDLNLLRTIYYIIVVMITLVLGISKNIADVFIVVSIYYLIYRTSILVVSKLKKFK